MSKEKSKCICEYCKKECKKAEKRVRYFFIVVEHEEPIHPEGIEAHVDENHHQIMVCKKCEQSIFKDRSSFQELDHEEKASPKRKSPTRKAKASPKKA